MSSLREVAKRPNPAHIVVLFLLLEIGQSVVGFDVENSAVLKCRRFVGSGRIGRLRIAGRCRRAGRDGRRVAAAGRQRRDGNSGGRRCDAGRVGLPSDVFGVWQFVVFLPLHAPVLEPDFDLTLRQAEAVSDLDPTAPRQVPIKVKLFLQFENLVSSVGRPLSFRLHSRRESSIG